MPHAGIGADHGEPCGKNQQNAAGGFQLKELANTANQSVSIMFSVQNLTIVSGAVCRLLLHHSAHIPTATAIPELWLYDLPMRTIGWPGNPNKMLDEGSIREKTTWALSGAGFLFPSWTGHSMELFTG
jgi:hypothetical protein